MTLTRARFAIKTTTKEQSFPVIDHASERRKRSFSNEFKKHIGRFAVGTFLLSGLANLGGYSSSANIEKAPAPEITYALDNTHPEPLNESQSNPNKTFLGSKAIQLHYSPNFIPDSLQQNQLASINEEVKNAVDFLKNNPTESATIVVTGESSDEDGTNPNDSSADIGESSINNKKLAEERRDMVYESAVAYMNTFEVGNRLKIEKGDAKEFVIGDKESQNRIAAFANSRGISVKSFLSKYNNQRDSLKLLAEETKTMFGFMDAHRGAELQTFVSDSEASVSSMDIMPQVENTQQIIVENKKIDDGNVMVMPGYMPPVGRILRRRRRSYVNDGNGYREATKKEIIGKSLMQIKNSPYVVNEFIENRKQIRRRRDVLEIEAIKERRNEIIKLGAAGLAASAILTPLIPQITVESDGPKPTRIETSSTVTEFMPAHTKREMLIFPIIERLPKKWGLGRRFTLSESRVPAAEKIIPRSNLYTFDNEGKLISGK